MLLVKVIGFWKLNVKPITSNLSDSNLYSERAVYLYKPFLIKNVNIFLI